MLPLNVQLTEPTGGEYNKPAKKQTFVFSSLLLSATCNFDLEEILERPRRRNGLDPPSNT